MLFSIKHWQDNIIVNKECKRSYQGPSAQLQQSPSGSHHEGDPRDRRRCRSAQRGIKGHISLRVKVRFLRKIWFFSYFVLSLYRSCGKICLEKTGQEQFCLF